jgi:type VI protein secretion system component VasF
LAPELWEPDYWNGRANGDGADLSLSQGPNLKALARLWGYPGQAPAGLEQTLECYALALALGFRGRLAAPGQEEAAASLLAVASDWLTSRRPLIAEEASPEPAPAPVASFWERHRAFFWHGLVPALITLAVFLKGLAVVESLPF